MSKLGKSFLGNSILSYLKLDTELFVEKYTKKKSTNT